MQLTIQQFSQVVEALKLPSYAAKATEKRRFNRIAVQAKIQAYELRGEDLGRCFSAMTRDISYGGMGLIQGHGLSRQDRLIVVLPSGGEPLRIASNVTFSEEKAEGLFGVGIEFSDLIAPEAFERMLDREAERKRERQRIASSILG